MDVTSILGWVGASGGLPPKLRLIAARLTGFRQALTTRCSVTALLDLAGVCVPYAPRSALLGLDAFPLALDGAAHDQARSMVGAVLTDTAGAHANGLDKAGAVVSKAMALATLSPFDATAVLVEPALLAWIETWFGLSGQGVSLLRSGRLIMHATFLNPTTPNGSVDTEGLATAVDWIDLETQRLAELLPAAPHGTVGAELLGKTADAMVAARHVLALTVGPLALGAWALHLALSDLLERSWVLDGIKTGEDAAAAYASALRRLAPLPGVLRYNPLAREIPGRGTATATVPEGPVFVATACAERLDRESDEPLLAFGSGIHRCLGPTQMTDVAAVILGALGARSPRWAEGHRRRRYADPGPAGVQEWPFPGPVMVRLLR